MAGASGKKLDETYKLAWLRGLKTTYYLRTQSATNAEKSTVKSSQLNAVSSGARSTSPVGRSAAERRIDVEPRERHDARVRCEVLRARQPRVRSVPVIANAMRQSNIHAAMLSISLGLSHKSLG